MLIVLQIKVSVSEVVVQRMSDGSDRENKTVTNYEYVISDNEKVYKGVFGNELSTEDILSAFNNGLFIETTESQDVSLLLLRKLKEQQELIDLLLQMQLEKEGIL